MAYVSGLAGALCAAGVAQAAPGTVAFAIPRKALSAALIDFATQARVSIGTRDAAYCAGESRPLVGRFTPEAGLARILAGSGCGFRRIDAGAFEVVRLPPPRLVAPPPIQAPADEALSELVVVATRRPTPADRLAYPVSSANDQALARLGIHDAGGLALTTPSMTVTNLGSGRDKILLRGLSDGPLTGRTQSMVGLYLDDVRVTYNAPDPDLRLVDMAQVEVLRGPQGALYGAGSLGGVLHLVTAPPDSSRSAAWVSTTAGVTRGGAASWTAEGMLNLPFAAGRGAARLVAYRDVQGGYIDDWGTGLTNVNRSARKGGRLAVAFDLSDSWALSAGLVGQAIDSADTQYADAGAPPYTRRSHLREPHDNDFTEAHAGVKGDFDWGAARWSTALVRHHIFSRYDATTAPPVPVPPGAAAFDDNDDIASLVTEATVASASTAPIQWLAGAFFARTHQDIDLSLTVRSPAQVTAFEEARHDRLVEGALYGEAVLPVTSALNLTLGGRAFVSRTTVESVIRSPLAGATTGFSGKLTRSGLAPKVVLAYSLSPTALFYAQAAEGYRSGGVNTTAPPGQAFGAPGGPEPYRYYQGDELWSFEAGVKLAFLDGRLRLRGAVFDAAWKNIQSDQLLASGLPFTANIGDGRNLGVELESSYQLGGLLLRGNFLLNAPELEHANPAFPARADLGLAGVPHVSFGGSAHYAWSLPQGRSVELDARYAYIGRSRLTFDAVTSPRMGGYGAGRIAATLAAERWRVTFALDNPADARGDTFSYGNPFTVRSARQVTPLRPRSASLTLQAFY